MPVLTDAKVHEQSGTMRMRVPADWKNNNRIKSKDTLQVIVSHCLIVLPPGGINDAQLDETISDMKSLVVAARILSANKDGETR
jgi:hypothetical protein